MALSKQQINVFNTFGYLNFPGLFADSIEKIIEEFETIWVNNGGGHFNQDHDYKQRSAIIQFIDQSEYLSALLDDERIEGAIASLLGPDFNYSGSDGNLYVGETRYHSDGFDRHIGYTSVKIAFYLDPVTSDSGCLRVIPGSHIKDDTFAEGLESFKVAGHADDTMFGQHGSNIPAVPLESTPGDMLLFNHRIKHGSFGGGGRRRMFTMNFAEKFRQPDLDMLRNDIGETSRFWIDKPYGDIMINTASPTRMIHLEQTLANCDHLPALSRKAREEMGEPSRH